jgi:hypothetical protein
MDIRAMMSQKNAMEEEEEETQSKPNPAAAWKKKKPTEKQQNLENMDVNKMMEQMSQAMGGNMSPEKKEQVLQAMSQAMNLVKGTKEGPGAANRIWQIIPRRPGDKVGAELKTMNVLNVTMGTKAPLQSVFRFYLPILIATKLSLGWFILFWAWF